MIATISRHIDERARRYLDAFPVLLIEGARQVGKSTLARQLAPQAQVLNLEIPEIRDAVAADQMGALRNAGPGTVIVDEIQLMPELTRSVKALVDADRSPGRFILTGSATLLRVKGSADSLAGRVSRLELFGFSQGERLQTRDDFVSAIMARADPRSWDSDWARSDYIRLAAEGSYPPALDLPSDLRKAWLRDYLASLTHRDMLELRRQVQPGRAEAILRLLAVEQCHELVRHRLADRTSVPASTVTGYLDLLCDVGLLRLIKPWTPNLAKREVGRSKSLIIDSALALQLAGLSVAKLDNLLHQEALGHVLEGFVASELLRQQTWAEVPFDLYHYRDSDGAEVDLIIETEDGDVLGIEVKAASSYSARQFCGLRKIADQLGDRFVAGFVLGTAPNAYRYAPKLWGLPIAALWEGPARAFAQ